MLGELAGRLVEAVLEAEMREHLGHPPGARPRGANVRNGTSSKVVQTDLESVRVRVPRDRDGSFSPRLVPKRRSRLKGVSAELVLGLFAGELAVEDLSMCSTCASGPSRVVPECP